MKLERRALQILGLCKLVETPNQLPSVTGGDCYCTKLKPERGWQMGSILCVCGGKIRKKQEKARPVFEEKITPKHLPPCP